MDSRQGADPLQGRKVLWFAAAAAALVVAEIAIRTLFLPVPLNDNEGANATVGRWMNRGSLLYVDLVEIKPPLLFLTNAAVDRLAPASESAIRWMAACHRIATLLLLLAFSSLAFSPKAALTAGALYVGYGLAPAAQPWAANADPLMQPYVAAGMLLARLAGAAGSPWAAASAGAMFGLAAGVKQTSAVFALLFGIFWSRRGEGRATILLMAGFVGAQILLYAAAGFPPLAEYTRWIATVNFLYIGHAWTWQHQGHFEVLWREVLPAFVQYAFILAGAVAFLASGIGQTENLRVLAVWLLGAIVSIAAGGWGYRYWLAQIVPPACVATALAFAAWKRPIARWFLGVAIAVNLVAAVSVVHGYLTLSRASYARLAYSTNVEWEAPRRVGEYLRAQKRPGDRLYVFGTHPEIYWYSDLRPADASIWHALVDMIPGEEERFERNVIGRPPEWIVVVREKHGRNSKALIRLLAHGYRGDKSFYGFEGFDVWRRTSPPS